MFSDDQIEEPFKKFVKLLASFYLNSLEVTFNQKIANKSCGNVELHVESGLTKGEFVDAVNELFGKLTSKQILHQSIKI